jgi:hypothetical protein
MSDHWQSTVFPNEPIFKLLLEAARENRHVAVSDSIRGVNASYAQLLVDICTMHEEIRKRIPQSMFDARGLMPLEATCIFILGPASYVFILASFTALSLGGAICPLGRSNKGALSTTSINASPGVQVLEQVRQMRTDSYKKRNLQ